MISLIKREFLRGWKSMLCDSVLSTVVILVVAVAFIIWSEQLSIMCSYLFGLPQEAYALLGYMEEMDTERIEFYIYPIIMILQFCLIWRACNLTTRCIYEDELNGTIYYICNQVFSRAELAVAKFIWMVLRFGIVYGLNVMIVSIAMVLGSGEDMAEYVLLLPKGIIVGTFFIVITLLFCMIRKKNHYYEYDIRIQLLLLVPIIASNLYKIVNVFCWVGNYIGVGDKLFNSFDEIILLKYLSPLSWLNPYLGYSNEKQITYFFILATISILCCLAYVHLYKKRNFNYFLSN